MKKISIYFVVTIVVGSLIFFGIQYMAFKDYKKNTNDKKNNNSIESITYDKYKELLKSDSKFIIFISNDSDISHKMKQEISIIIKNKNIKVYELDLNKLSDLDNEEIINNISEILNRDDKYLLVPALICKNKDNLVIEEGLKNSDELMSKLDKYNIE